MYGGAGSCSSAALKMSWCSNTEFTFLALVHSAPPIQTAIQAHLHAAIIFPLLWGKTPHTLLHSLAADKLLCKLQMINQETGLTGKKSEELAQSSQQHATSWVCCRRCQTRALRPKCLLHRSRRYMLETFFTSMNEQTCELFVTKRCKKKKKNPDLAHIMGAARSLLSLQEQRSGPAPWQHVCPAAGTHGFS